MSDSQPEGVALPAQQGEENSSQHEIANTMPAAGQTMQAKKHVRGKIKIEYLEDKNRRHLTFSKRKAGIMKKAYELSTLTGTQVLLLVASETGHVYTFATPKLQPLITKQEGKNRILACLHAPDPSPPGGSGTASNSNSGGAPAGGQPSNNSGSQEGRDMYANAAHMAQQEANMGKQESSQTPHFPLEGIAGMNFPTSYANAALSNNYSNIMSNIPAIYGLSQSNQQSGVPPISRPPGGYGQYSSHGGPQGNQ